MNYIQQAQDILRSKIEVEEDLLDLYTLLVFVKGEGCTWRHVHDAWSIWKNSWGDCEHKSLVPFEQLPPEIQKLDEKYCNAIIETSRALKSQNNNI